MRDKKRAFTILELLVTVIIVGIMAAIGVINYMGAQDRSNYSKVVSDFEKITTSAELYKADFKVYPGDGLGVIPSSFDDYLDTVPVPPCKGYTYDWENWETPVGHYVAISYREPNDPDGGFLAYIVAYHNILNNLDNYAAIETQGPLNFATMDRKMISCNQKALGNPTY